MSASAAFTNAWTPEGRLCKACECIDTVYTRTNYWKEPFYPYNSSMWIISLFCNFSSRPSSLPRVHYIPELYIAE